MRRDKMNEKEGWTLKGTFYECCRALDGQCGLQFGREMPHPCTALTTYQIREGQIQGVDMKGINIFFLMDGIGPKPGDVVDEGAAYISDNATEEQRKILEPFVIEKMEGRMWEKTLGVKFVKISISEKDGTYSITMPFGEQNLTLTVGGDGKTPIRIENQGLHFLTGVKVCTGLWKYHDYGKNLEYRNTSGQIAEFALQGN
jgi:hypothetical protein